MKSLNSVQLVGWLGRDPKIIRLRSGNLVARMRLATDYLIPQAEGLPKKKTCWHTVKLWRQKQIEYYCNCLVKGSHLLVSGRIVYREYENRLGKKCIEAEIIANYIIDLDR